MPEDELELPVVSVPLLASPTEDIARPVPDHLPLSTVSEITSWLVGHTIETVERELILHTLHHCAGNRSWAAGILGIPVATLEAKLASYAGPRIARPQRGDNENDPLDLQDDLPPQPFEPRRVYGRHDAADGVGLRWVIGSVLTVLAVIAIAFRFFGDNAAVASLVRADPPRIELSILERRLPPPQPATVRSLILPTSVPRVEFSASVDIAQDTRMDSAPASAATAMPAVMPRETLAEAAAVGFEEKAVTITAFESQLPKLEELDFDASAAVLAAISKDAPEPAPLPSPRHEPIVVQQKREARPAPAPAAPAAAQAKPKEFNPLHIIFPFAVILSAANEKAGSTAGTARPLCCNN